MSQTASGILREWKASARGRALEQLQAGRRRARITGWTESSAWTTASENQIRHCHIDSEIFCEKGHTDYDIYRATKDTVNVI